MRKATFLLLTIVLNLSNLDAGASEVYELSLEEISLQDIHYPFVIERVSDATRLKIYGTVHTGWSPKRVVFSSGLQSEFSKVVGQIQGDVNRAIEMEVQWFSIKEQLIHDFEYAFAELRVNFYALPRAEGDTPMFSSAGTRQMASVIDATSKHNENIEVVLTQCLIDFAEHLRDVEQVEWSYQSYQKISTEDDSDGIYGSFSDFEQGEMIVLPKEANPIYETRPNGNIIIRKIKDHPIGSDHWGLRIAGADFVKYGRHYFPIRTDEHGRNPGIFVSTVDLEGNADVIAMGMMFGLIGAGLMSLAKSSSRGFVYLHLDTVSGALISPHELSKRRGLISVLVAGSPFMKKREKIDVLVGGILVCKLGRDEYFLYTSEGHDEIQEICLDAEGHDRSCLEVDRMKVIQGFEFDLKKRRGIYVTSMKKDELLEYRVQILKNQLRAPCED